MHLVSIVSRESERLNHIITDFLNYSREKTYEFRGSGRARVAGRNVDADREEAGNRSQISNRAGLQRARHARAVDSSKIKQVFWNLCDNALRAMPEAARLRWGWRSGRSGCASPFAIPASGWMPSSARRFLSRCNRDFRGHRFGAVDRVPDRAGAQRADQCDFAKGSRCGIYRGTAAGGLRQCVCRPTTKTAVKEHGQRNAATSWSWTTSAPSASCWRSPFARKVIAWKWRTTWRPRSASWNRRFSTS